MSGSAEYNAEYKERLASALRVYKARRDRTQHPVGAFDKAGRWEPGPGERQFCCHLINRPSRVYPYSMLLHCRTMPHIARLLNVSEDDLRVAVRADHPRKKPRREGGDDYYKAVAVVDGRYFSIFDGATEYVVGETLHQTASAWHGGGYYAYRTLDEAATADIPPNARFLDQPRAILRVRGEGRYCTYDNDKLAFSKLTPLEVVTTLADYTENTV